MFCFYCGSKNSSRQSMSGLTNSSYSLRLQLLFFFSDWWEEYGRRAERNWIEIRRVDNAAQVYFNWKTRINPLRWQMIKRWISSVSELEHTLTEVELGAETIQWQWPIMLNFTEDFSNWEQNLNLNCIRNQLRLQLELTLNPLKQQQQQPRKEFLVSHCHSVEVPLHVH